MLSVNALFLYCLLLVQSLIVKLTKVLDCTASCQGNKMNLVMLLVITSLCMPSKPKKICGWLCGHLWEQGSNPGQVWVQYRVICHLVTLDPFNLAICTKWHLKWYVPSHLGMDLNRVTYPDCCIRACPVSYLPRADANLITKGFLQDLVTKVPSLCGVKLRITSEAKHMEPVLTYVTVSQNNRIH